MRLPAAVRLVPARELQEGQRGIMSLFITGDDVQWFLGWGIQSRCSLEAVDTAHKQLRPVVSVDTAHGFADVDEHFTSRDSPSRVDHVFDLIVAELGDRDVIGSGGSSTKRLGEGDAVRREPVGRCGGGEDTGEGVFAGTFQAAQGDDEWWCV